ncbi:anti-sigma factor domain-containing protein [Pseudalkalibacillus sp. SCS-8]|uniref:anti-sigma factor n=1 Tax=Pseudalkalibacillus nanhaiensis TaxID=3115291 RepID=UPI0032DA474F
MNNQNHCDLLLDYFNQCLDEKEKERFEAHLAKCKACREELHELEELTADLPYASEPVEPNDGMKDRILSSVFEQPVENDGFNPGKAEKATVDPIQETAVLRAKKTSPVKRWLQPLLAASLLLSLTANVYFYMNDEPAPLAVPDEGVNQVLKNVELAATEGFDARAQATMIQKKDGMSLVMQAENLQKLSGTEAYQVWLINSNGEKFRAGTFLPNHKGQGGVIYPVNIEGEHEWDTIAVTLEPTPDSEQPKGQIILASKL